MEKTNFQDFFFKSIPVFGSILVFLGLSKQYNYYWGFGINILYFVDLTEVITGFFDDIDLLFVTSLAILIGSKQHLSAVELQNRDAIKNSIATMISPKKKMILYWRCYKSQSVAFLVMFIAYSVLAFFNLHIFGRLLLYFVVGVTSYFAFVYIQNETRSVNGNFQIKLSHGNVYLIAVALSLINLSFLPVPYFQAYMVKHRKIIFGTTIYLDSSVLKSDSSNFYIGQTKNYLFYYHQIKKTTDVYPMSKVKQVTVVDRN